MKMIVRMTWIWALSAVAAFGQTTVVTHAELQAVTEAFCQARQISFAKRAE